MSLSGSPIDYLFAFLGGILVSFTPCVYPLIPISAGYIGLRSSGSALRGLLLSLVYVTGLAVTYSILGLFASLTGTVFGQISSSPITYIFVGAIVIFFGVSLLDLFTLPIPNPVKLTPLKKQNYFSTFLLGLSSGLISSPCLTPVLGSILVYLTTKKNILYGMTLLFSFAFGMGFILIVIGMFSSILLNLPKSGKWLIFIKRIFAVILIAAGIGFIFVGIRRL